MILFPTKLIKKVDVQNICVKVIAQRTILNSESFFELLDSKGKIRTYVMTKEEHE